MSVEIVPVSGFRGVREPGDVPLGEGEAEAIAANWAKELARNPKLFDGRILMSVSTAIVDGALVASYRETGFSAYMWWRHVGHPKDVRNVFGAAAVRSSDGAFLLGRMAGHTSNPGQTYFPAGTPDRDDVVGEGVDLEASIVRELEEETGLGSPLVRPTATRIAVFDDAIVACFRVFETDLDAAALKLRVETTLAAQAEPEFDAVVAARSSDALDATSPAYARAALAYLLGA